MDAALKAKWVEALRSGKYQQARRELRKGNNFCCLGVMLDLQSAEWNDSGVAEIAGRQVWSLDTPPAEVLGGLPFEVANDLIALNDGTQGKHEHSFAEIADYIEKNL